jgi:AcrR family transcriptional regulator
MERPLRADARRNRERLLQVAKEAFAEEGVAVPLDEIARRAGLGPGTLYRHFPTKEALFEAVVQDRFQRMVEDARALHAAPDAGAALFGFVERLVAEAAPKQDLVDALAGSGVDVRSALAATGGDLRAEIAGLLRRAQTAGDVRADVTIADLMALLSGLLMALRARSHGAADPERAVAVLCQGLRA